MEEKSSLSESETSAESDIETSSTEEKNKSFHRKRKGKYHHFSRSKTNVKESKKLKKSSSTAGKTFTYLGKTRQEKKGSSLSGDSLPHSSSSVQQPPFVSSFTTHQSAHDIATDEFPSAIGVEALDKLRREVQRDIESMQVRQHRTWQERHTIGAWGQHARTRIFTEYVSRQPLLHSKCDQCHGVLNYYAVRCMTCKKHLCHQCDANTHSSMPFHRRLLCSCETLETLQPHHFIDEEGNIITKDVCLPCFVPNKCCDVNCLGSMSLTPNLTESIVVVTEQGRFLLKGTSFVCDTCHTVMKATIDDYIFSGFFPASLSENVTYLFSEEALLLGYHISHKCPGSSKNMYARTLEDVSKEYGRNGPINVPLFTTAEREWETCRHYIDQEVLKRDKTDCPSCGTKPLIRSSDAIIKLRRLASAERVRKPQNERVPEEPQSRFGNLIIKSDVEVEKFRQRIYNKIKTSKKKQMCGGSAFTAAREDSKEQKKYDETGLVVSSCKHCIVPYAINMFKGESWTHTAFMHYEAWKSQATFFCYDVVCQYWKWMIQKVGPQFPEYLVLTNEMKGILPIMHQMAHQLPCQVLWNPRWTKGLGLTGGEEHEQVFSKLYRYAYVLKHMSKINRSDFLTLAILYWNWNKIQTMPVLLRKKLERARKEIRESNVKLNELLKPKNIKYSDLPLIHNELERKAKETIYQRKTKNTPVDKLRRMLEGYYVQLKTVAIKISKEAENSKTRTKMRRILTETKKKALETIELLNSKNEELEISYENFNKGVFPWEAAINENDSQFPTLSYAEKYHVVDCWMLLQRANEEVILTKNEMINYVQFLTEKRSSLKQSTHSEEEDKAFRKGKKAMTHSEIEQINSQIQLSLKLFNLNCNNDFSNFTRETDSNYDTELEFETSEEETENSTTELDSSSEEQESL